MTAFLWVRFFARFDSSHIRLSFQCNLLLFGGHPFHLFFAYKVSKKGVGRLLWASFLALPYKWRRLSTAPGDRWEICSKTVSLSSRIKKSFFCYNPKSGCTVSACFGRAPFSKRIFGKDIKRFRIKFIGHTENAVITRGIPSKCVAAGNLS